MLLREQHEGQEGCRGNCRSVKEGKSSYTLVMEYLPGSATAAFQLMIAMSSVPKEILVLETEVCELMELDKRVQC